MIILIGVLSIICIFYLVILIMRLWHEVISDYIARIKIIKTFKRGDIVYRCNFIKDEDTGELMIERNTISEETIVNIYSNTLLHHYKIEQIITNKAIYYSKDIMSLTNGSLWRKEDVDFLITTLNNEKTLSEIMSDDKQLIIYSLKMLLQQSLKYGKDNISERVNTLIEQLENKLQ